MAEHVPQTEGKRGQPDCCQYKPPPSRRSGNQSKQNTDERACEGRPKQHHEHPVREFTPSVFKSEKSEREIGKRAKQRKPTANTCGRMPFAYVEATVSHWRLH